MPAPKTISPNRNFQNSLGVPRFFNVSNRIKQIDRKLLSLGFAGLSYRDAKLLGQLAQAGLMDDSLVGHWAAGYGVAQSSNAVSSWLNLATSNVALNKNLEQVTAANMPTWLDWTGENYGYLNGVATNNFSTPHSTALAITGSIDIRCDNSLVDWTPNTISVLAAKDNGSAAGRCWQYNVQISGILRFAWSTDGTTLKTADSTMAPTIADYARLQTRVTLDTSTGDVTFYTRTDGIIDSATGWTQLGTTVSTAAGALYNGTSTPVYIGARQSSVNESSGNFYRAQIYNGIAGTLAFDFNPATYTNGSTFTDSSVNGATITIQGSATVVTSPSIFFDGVNDYLKTGSFALTQPTTVYFCGKQVSWIASDYMWDGFTVNSGAVIQTTSSPQLNLNAGSSVAANTDLALKTGAVITAIYNGASSSLTINRGTATTGNAGAGNMNGLTLGASATPGGYGNISAMEYMVFSQAHDSAQRAAIANYFNSKYSLGI